MRASFPLTRSPYPAISTTSPYLPPEPSSILPSRAIMNTSSTSPSACFLHLSAHPQVHSLSNTSFLSANSSYFSSFSMPPILSYSYQVDPLQSLRAHLKRDQSLSLRSTCFPLRIHFHSNAPLLAQSPRLLLLEEGHCFRDQALSFCNMQSSPPREVLDASSLSTLVQMVSAGIGVTLIPEMAVAVETRSASVSVARFKNPQPSRTIGMIWRKTSPLARQLMQFSEVVCLSAEALRKQHDAGSASRNPRA